MRNTSLSAVLVLGIVLSVAAPSTSLAGTDLFTAIEEISTELASIVEDRDCIVGPIWNAYTERIDRVGVEGHDELVQNLAGKGVDLVPMENDDQAALLDALAAAGFVVTDVDLTDLTFLGAHDVLIVGSMDKWGRDFILKVRAFQLPGMKVLGGSSKYLDRNSLPSDYVQVAFDMDNPSDERMYDAGRADYESTAIAAGFGTFPGHEVENYYAVFENKLSNYFTFSAMISSFSGEEDADTYGGVEYVDSMEGTMFIAATRYYPFYRGRGMRGFFLGGGLGVLNLKEYDWRLADWNNPNTVYKDEDEETGALVFFEFGRKIMLGTNMSLEPVIQLMSITGDDGGSTTVGWIGASLGILW